MRIRRPIIVVVALVAISVVVFAALVLMSSSPSEYKATDGSVVRVEKAIYGKRGPYVPPVGWKERFSSWFERVLPKSLKAKLAKPSTAFGGTWYQNSLVHSNTDALHIWVTRRDALSGELRNVGVEYGEITDSHGCVYRSTQSGGENYLPLTPANKTTTYKGAQSSVVWLTFEGFPRHESRFNLRLYDWSGTFLGEMMVANPAPRPKPALWTVGSFPVVEKQGEVSFALTKVGVKTNTFGRKPGGAHFGLPYELVPSFEITANGAPTEGWKALQYELWDISGNYSSSVYATPRSVYLCPHEPAWKLVTTFYGRENAPGASNMVWKLSGVRVPGPGEYTRLETSSMPEGMIIKPVAIGGIGETVYSNGVVVSSTVLNKPAQPLEAIERSGWVTGITSKMQTVRGQLPHLAMFVAGLTNVQLTVLARDDQGREVYADQWHYGAPRDTQLPSDIHYLLEAYDQDAAFYELNLWPDAKTVDLTFCIHQPRTVGFIFKPPQLDKK